MDPHGTALEVIEWHVAHPTQNLVAVLQILQMCAFEVLLQIAGSIELMKKIFYSRVIGGQGEPPCTWEADVEAMILR